MTNPFHGMGIALVTPFTPTGEIDFQALQNLVNHHLASGADFLCVLGTTAETPTLTLQEKRKVMQCVIETANHRVPLLLGCGSNDTAAVCHFLQTENLEGFQGVLVVTPYYNKPTQEGLYQHFIAVAKATHLPVVLYNVPGRTGVNLEASTTLRIATAAPNVVAIKEASGNIRQIEAIIEGAPQGFEVLSGDDAITLELIAIGAVGVISVVGNAYPFQFSKMVHHALQGNIPDALKWHRLFANLYGLMSVEGNPSGIKCLLSEQGKSGPALRLPLVPVSATTKEKIQAAIAQFDTESSELAF